MQQHSDEDTNYTLFHCEVCSLEHWQPLAAPRADYYEGEAQAMYAAMHEGGRRAEEDPRFSRFLDEFGSRTGARLLDVGCADGALMAAFRARGNEVWGIDIDTRSLGAARRRGLEVREATLDTVGDALGHDLRFDFITMFDVLEHLTAPRRALALTSDLMAPGGYLVGTVPNRERLFANLVDADFPPHHFLRFDREALKETLVKAGFEPASVEVFQWGYSGPVLVNAAVRGVKRAILPLTRRFRRPAGTPSPDRTQGGDVGRRHWKHAAARIVTASAARVLRPFERGFGRGFKLYFVARWTG